jgi:hypothetical protein
VVVVFSTLLQSEFRDSVKWLIVDVTGGREEQVGPPMTNGSCRGERDRLWNLHMILILFRVEERS